jgi:hypothetical protein
MSHDLFWQKRTKSLKASIEVVVVSRNAISLKSEKNINVQFLRVFGILWLVKMSPEPKIPKMSNKKKL